MEELAKTIQQKYIDELVAKYPLHRFVIFFVFLVATYSYNVEGTPLIKSLMNIKVSFLLDFKDGLASKISFFHIFICVALTGISGVIFEKISIFFFNTFIYRYNIENLTKELKARYEKIRTNNDLVNYYLSKDITTDLEKKKIRMRCFTINIEYLSAILISLIWGVNVNGLIEILTTFVVILVIAMLQFKLFIFYIHSFIPLHVAEKVLQGTDIDISPPL